MENNIIWRLHTLDSYNRDYYTRDQLSCIDYAAIDVIVYCYITHFIETRPSAVHYKLKWCKFYREVIYSICKNICFHNSISICPNYWVWLMGRYIMLVSILWCLSCVCGSAACAITNISIIFSITTSIIWTHSLVTARASSDLYFSS